MNRLDTEMLKDWFLPIIAQKYSRMMVGIGRIPDLPDRVILIESAGLGEDLYNGDFERRTYRFTCRGKTNSPIDAENIANLAQDICDGITNLDITEDVRILSMQGRGKPRQLNITDSQSRYRFVVEIEVISSQEQE